MGADLTKLSDDDLLALKSGDLSKVSDAGLLALKGQPSAPAVEKKAPSYGERIGSIGTAALQGLMQGGPFGMVSAANAESMKQQGEFLNGLGYKGGGAVTDWMANKGFSPETSAGAGFAANIGIQALPAYGAGKVVEAVASPGMASLGRRVMQSAVKPSSADLLSGDAAKGIQTLLDEGINVTPSGMAELRRRVGDLNGQVKDLIANSGKDVNAVAAANVDRALNSFRYSIANRDANLASVKDAQTALFKALDDLDPMWQYSGSTSVQLAQKIKQATQRTLSDFYGELSGAQMEGLKDVTRGLRLGIDKAEPATAPLNAKQAELLNALSVSEKHALMALNKNPAGLSLLAENPKAAAAFMGDRSAAFKSIVARMLYSGRDRIPEAAGMGAAAAYENATQNSQ